MSSHHDNLILRARMIRAIRSFFEERGFLEVETPHRIPANAPEEHIEPFRSGNLYLHTSPEICMKRLLCRGYDKIFQVCRCWRGSERGERHLPEFTMLEWYRADSNYETLMDDCEQLLRHIFRTCTSDESMCYNGIPLVLGEVFRRISVAEAFENFSGRPLADVLADGSFDEIMVTCIEPALVQSRPVFLVDYPIEMAALARQKPGDPNVAERFELYACGLELANGFSELNDPEEQHARFLKANREREEQGYPALPIPVKFLDELPVMPPSAGIALGVDRLVMLFSGAMRIDDVIAFTPEDL